ncbi:Clavaminate synthase-like protein [Lindgomyces ingoldianus]|uniref:Clavaminate synthase-like protein n=1 Tax=Lindgomyces ingoldianus TaxID=673940 RepID=A0ACB6QSJ9_9PLEO|nr:Clavaminate synthase-like protein [Lindgomyces ingoldianus]KAF2469085.1 Clavaminate synthase-like protein [Lindgomyces ingoldianus]
MAFSSPAPFPDFPSNLPTIQLPTLSLSKLVAEDEDETKRLFNTCISTGVFLLELQSSQEGLGLIKQVDDVFQLGERIFELGMEEKLRHSMLNGTVLGYKGAGIGRIDAKGTPDRCEFWCMSKDDVLGIVPALPAPEVVSGHRSLYANLARSCHSLSMTILDCLETQLGLSRGTFRACHRIEQPSSDQSRQICYLPQPEGDRRTSLVSHTDYGSVTILFNILGGLQVLPEGKAAEEENWLWVRPRPGCAIINLGDAMVKFTNGLLKSPMHRVMYAPGEQANLTRYSLAYFTRPEDQCLMKSLEGSAMISKLNSEDEDVGVTAGEWVRTRIKQNF